MEKIIACCGLNCATCDARKATITNDNKLRSETATKWRIQYNAPQISDEMINCTGCREAGAKFGHCEVCEIRNCTISKGFQTCADCDKLESCTILKSVTQFVPDAFDNLRSLN